MGGDRSTSPNQKALDRSAKSSLFTRSGGSPPSSNTSAGGSRSRDSAPRLPSFIGGRRPIFSPERVRRGLKLVWNLSLKERYQPGKLESALSQGRASPETAKMLRLLYDRRFRVAILDDVRHLARSLSTEHPGTGLAAMGFSMGGKLALELAAAFPETRACAAFSAAPVRGAALRKIRCPILLLYGSKDTFMTGDLPDFLRDAMDSGKDLTLKILPSAGHEFFDNTAKSGYNAPASSAAWSACLNLLQAAFSNR